jgi:hypothetical protein
MKASRNYYSDKEINYLKDICSKSINYNRAAIIASKKLDRTATAVYMKLRDSKYPLKEKEKKVSINNSKKAFVITITIEEK